ncbi:hypothetical protein [Allostreptomyces psammosilenae]|uniref:Uncharacterized protein n=1 Tax=Allostreptomyces psammosilenae TaxID=1892865 RepID=A0A852ZPT3_9ACTN|nr:hypothetical protein [Allostreptomyces psammosilenae]NYI04379.1 hypothetical protein [Allostreptomyces psammosilenae]
MNPETWAAHRALHGVFVQGRRGPDVQADIDAARDAFLGVLSAFFRNVMERPFTGHERREEVQAYLEALQRAYPAELAALEPAPMSVFVLEQIGPDAPPPGRSRIPVTAGLVYQMRLITEYTARQEGIVGQELETFLLGACARYQQGGS